MSVPTLLKKLQGLVLVPIKGEKMIRSILIVAIIALTLTACTKASEEAATPIAEAPVPAPEASPVEKPATTGTSAMKPKEMKGDMDRQPVSVVAPPETTTSTAKKSAKVASPKVAATSCKEKESEIPIPCFPWPPPMASATAIVPSQLLKPKNLLASTPTLKDVDEALSKALDLAGYTEKSYYAVPHGFAMATRLEQIAPDGTPMPESSRWITGKEPLSNFSLSTYLKMLFTANAGHYRVIVFVITPVPFTQKDVTITSVEAKRWLVGGLNKLPESVGSVDYTNKFTCTALVYEFEQSTTTQTSREVKVPGRLSGKTHLMKARIWGTNDWEH